MPVQPAALELLKALAPESPLRFASDMHNAGFALRVSDPAFVQRTRVIPFVHLPTGMPLDVVLAGSGLEDEFLRRAIVTDALGQSDLVPAFDALAARSPASAKATARQACGPWTGDRGPWTVDCRL